MLLAYAGRAGIPVFASTRGHTPPTVGCEVQKALALGLPAGSASDCGRIAASPPVPWGIICQACHQPKDLGCAPEPGDTARNEANRKVIEGSWPHAPVVLASLPLVQDGTHRLDEGRRLEPAATGMAIRRWPLPKGVRPAARQAAAHYSRRLLNAFGWYPRGRLRADADG